MYRIPHLHFDRFAFANHPHIRAPQLAQQVQRRLRLLPQGQAQRVLFATLLERLLHILTHAIEPVRRARSVDPLVRTLVIVVVYPVLYPLTSIGK
jgi:hypothetical protein